MTRAQLLKAILILGFIYFMTPSAAIVTSGYYSYLYKAAISLFSAAVVFKYCGFNKVTIFIGFLETVAIFSNIMMLFTQLSQHFPMWAFEIMSANYDNYKELPYYLFLLQLAAIAVSGISGFIGRAKHIFVSVVDRFRGSRNDLYLPFRWQ